MAAPAVLGLLLLTLTSAVGYKTYNVLDFKAVGDGQADDTNAFVQAWAAACADTIRPVLLVPPGKTFLIGETQLSGPCNSSVDFQLQGNVVAPNWQWTKKDKTNLLTFTNVNRLTLHGSGEIDGRGQLWWDLFKNKTLAFAHCNDLYVKGITIKNSADKHMTFFACVGVNINWIKITAPGDSPNTDGMYFSSCQNVTVSGSRIGTGDDCIAIGPGCSNINISSVQCGPGHGFSIGSLGKDGATQTVENISVSDSSVTDGLTGARIKTWQGGSGYVRGVVFEGMRVRSVQTPIMIDQFYCTSNNCQNHTTAVAISDVHYANIYGTATDVNPIKILCSESVPCQGIHLEKVKLSMAEGTTPLTSVCINVKDGQVNQVDPDVQCVAG
ncbi:hypothetical protein OPV22_024083 [Ensete ventricosum]|uniref:Polygalacturonase n=1 Tax=Ensete ventricosum TaxID=4639 RepID=A0AAV8QNP9_ENSVE|nr:hypothetical protein OPV22_024083 [Ensete ventricosum]